MLEKKVVSQCISSDYCRGWNDAVDAMPRWISVEERLPKHGAMVLCNTRDYIEVLQWDEKAMLWFGMRTINVKGFVTHWMPLPEPPKETSL